MNIQAIFVDEIKLHALGLNQFMSFVLTDPLKLLLCVSRHRCSGVRGHF